MIVDFKMSICIASQEKENKVVNEEMGEMGATTIDSQ